MGIPKFFRYISERYPCLTEKLKDYQVIKKKSHQQYSSFYIFLFFYIFILFCYLKLSNFNFSN